MGEAACHFEEEYGACDGGADAAGEEGGHGDDDHVRHVDGRKESHADEDASCAGTGEGADDEGGEEESARCAASKAYEGEEDFPRKEERQHGECWIACDDGVHDAVSAAKNLGKEKSEDACKGEGKGNFAESRFENGKTIEAVHMKESVVEWDCGGACDDGEKHDIGEMCRRERLDLGEEEDGAFSEEETDEGRGGDGRGHGGEQDGSGESFLHFFQYEEHACEGRVEYGRESGAGTAGKKEMFFQTAASGEAGYALGSSSSDLDGRARMAERHARADGKRSAADLYDEHPEPVHAHEPAENPFHLGDTASRRHRFPAAEPCEEPCEKGKPEKPEERRQKIVGEERRGEDFLI